MIEETARVIACEGALAEVETERRSACGGCQARGGCGTSLLAQVFGRRPARMWVENPIAARPGDQVLIGLSERGLMRASLLLYLAPLLGLIAGAVLGEQAAARLGLGGGEALSILFGLLGLAAGLWPARNFSRTARTNRVCRAVILQRVLAGGIPIRQPD